MSHNNNKNYFEASDLVSVYVSFVRPMINVWQLFTLRSKLSSNILYFHTFQILSSCCLDKKMAISLKRQVKFW